MVLLVDLFTGEVVECPEPAKYTHTCPHCEDSSSFNSKYDSYFCGACDVWLEKACTDPEVMIYFGGRPSTPSGKVAVN